MKHFVLDELLESKLAPRVRTKAMFGSLAVYVDEKIVFLLRNKGKPESSRDDGVWIAMLPEHTESVRKDHPVLRPIEMFANRGREGFTGWLNLPADSDQFEEAALAICRRVIKSDPRIGKVPKSKRRLTEPPSAGRRRLSRKTD